LTKAVHLLKYRRMFILLEIMIFLINVLVVLNAFHLENDHPLDLVCLLQYLLISGLAPICYHRKKTYNRIYSAFQKDCCIVYRRYQQFSHLTVFVATTMPRAIMSAILINNYIIAIISVFGAETAWREIPDRQQRFQLSSGLLTTVGKLKPL